MDSIKDCYADLIMHALPVIGLYEVQVSWKKGQFIKDIINLRGVPPTLKVIQVFDTYLNFIISKVEKCY